MSSIFLLFNDKLYIIKEKGRGSREFFTSAQSHRDLILRALLPGTSLPEGVQKKQGRRVPCFFFLVALAMISYADLCLSGRFHSSLDPFAEIRQDGGGARAQFFVE